MKNRRYKKFLNKFIIDKIIGYTRNICKIYAKDSSNRDNSMIISLIK